MEDINRELFLDFFLKISEFLEKNPVEFLGEILGRILGEADFLKES